MSQTILNDDSLAFAEKMISVKADGSKKVHHAGEIAVLPDLSLTESKRAC